MKQDFCSNLRALRCKRDYTQSKMAEMLGVTRPTYANYETARRSPDMDMLIKLGQVLDVTMDELFGMNTTCMADTIYETKSPYYIERAPKQPIASLGSGGKRPLAIGEQDFRKIRKRGSYYTDKTMMVAEFLDSAAAVTLITRPRRFGKTLNMSMLAEFLDCTKDSKDIFEGTAIMDTEFAEDMNSHPVVFISFLNVKGEQPDMLFQNLFFTLSEEYRRHRNVWQDEKLEENLQSRMWEVYHSLDMKEVKNRDIYGLVIHAIQMLCNAMVSYYGKAVYLLIDEYDTPFIEAYDNGYYSEVHGFLASLLTSALKGNTALNQAMLTGIKRVAKENIFSGLNNLLVCTVKDPEYSQYFGFTEQETDELLNYYDMELTEEVKAMYSGYLFDQTEVYNPWSVINYASRKRMDPYWVNTSENKMIRDAISQCPDEFRSQYEELIERGSVLANVQIETSFYEYKSSESLWGLLVNAGMVTVEEIIEGDFYCLRIPNHEVKKAFHNLTACHLQLNENDLSVMFFYLKRGDMQKFEKSYYNVLLRLPSYHDLKDENSYHMLMLGMCAFLSADYDIQSNRENGNGRGDIIMQSKNGKYPNMILEFKYTKDENKDLGALAKEAVRQVKKKKYDVGMQGHVRYIGLAHFGKDAKIVWEDS